MSGSSGEASLVGDHDSPQVVRQPSLEAARGLIAGLALGDLRVEVAAPRLLGMRTWVTAMRWIADLGRRSPVRESQWWVRSPEATFYGSDPGVGRERVRGREPCCGRGSRDGTHGRDRSDPVHLAVCRAGVVERDVHPLLDVGEAGIDRKHIPHQVVGDGLAGVLACRCRSDRTR